MADELTNEQEVSVAEMVNGFASEFLTKMRERHDDNSDKYGNKFLTVDTVEEAMMEIVDLGNYAMYTFVKLRLLQMSIMNMAPAEEIPMSTFVSAKEFTSPKEN